MVGTTVLVELWPRRAADGVAEPLRLIGGDVRRADWLGQQWHPALARLPRLTSRLGFDGQAFGEGAVATVGAISAAASHPAVAAVLGHVWQAAAVTIRTVAADGVDADVVDFWTGLAADAGVSGGAMTVRLADPAEALKLPVLGAAFAGTGGLEGPVELKGRRKPLAWGTVENIPIILIDSADLVYLAIAGDAALDAVKDGGVPFTLGPQAADLAALKAVQIPAGQVAFSRNANATLIRPWTQPGFTLTADITAGALTKPGEIAQALVAGRIPFAAGTVAAFDAIQPGPIGVFVDDEQSVVELLDRIFSGLGAWWKLNAAGEIELGLFDPAAPPVATFETQVAELARIGVLAPTAKRLVGYRRNFRPMADGEIAGAVSVDFATQITGAEKPADNADVTAPLGSIRINKSSLTTAVNTYAFIHGFDALGVAVDADAKINHEGSVITIPRHQFVNGASMKAPSEQGSGQFIMWDTTNPAPGAFTVDGETVNIAAVHNFGAVAGWFYLSTLSGGQVSFTPTDTMVLIGEIDQPATNPAAPITRANLYPATRPWRTSPAVGADRTGFNMAFDVQTGSGKAVAEAGADKTAGKSITVMTDLLPNNVGAEIVAHRGVSAPADTTRLWIDTSGAPEVLKRHDGTSWVKVAPTLPAHVGAEIVAHRGVTAPSDTTRLWIDTSVTPNLLKRHDGTAWVKATPTKTGELSDDANLGGTAAWTGVMGAGKPADGADVALPAASAAQTTANQGVTDAAAAALVAAWGGVTGAGKPADGADVALPAASAAQTTANQGVTDAAAAALVAAWSGVTGAGKPTDGADVTGDNTAADTALVAGELASDVAGQALAPSQNLMGLDAGPEHLPASGANYVFSGFGSGTAGHTLADLGLAVGETITMSALVKVGNGALFGVFVSFSDAAGTAISSLPFTGTTSATYVLDSASGVIPANTTHVNIQTAHGVAPSGHGIKQAVLNRGPVALAFAEPPIRAAREDLDALADSSTRFAAIEASANNTESRTAADTAKVSTTPALTVRDGAAKATNGLDQAGNTITGKGIDQGDTFIRALTHGLGFGFAVDGAAVTFAHNWANPPNVQFLTGGLTQTDQITTGNQVQVLQAQNVTISGFAPLLRVRGTVGTANPVTDTGATAGTTPQWVMNKSAADAFDDTYTFRFNVTVTNQFDPDFQGWLPGNVVVGIYLKDVNGVWVQQGTLPVAGDGSGASTVKNANVKSVIVAGVGATNPVFGVHLESSLYGGSLTSFTSVDYTTTPGPPQDFTATPAGSGLNVLYAIMGGAE